MNPFTIYPAIDLRGGHVVRLREGDPTRQTTFSSDPIAIGEKWKSQGARWLHVVNLDGAFATDSAPNLTALAALTQLGMKIQFGGGLRAAADLQRAFDHGVSRVVLGTSAVTNPAFVADSLARWGAERVAVGIDARNGIVRTHGWQQASSLTALDFGQQMAALGVQTFIFTDIARDGIGTGLNIAETVALAAATGRDVIASGGVKTIADVDLARQAGLAGCIVGRALYDGTIPSLAALAERITGLGDSSCE